jgi:hypothetical protein
MKTTAGCICTQLLFLRRKGEKAGASEGE